MGITDNCSLVLLGTVVLNIPNFASDLFFSSIFRVKKNNESLPLMANGPS